MFAWTYKMPLTIRSSHFFPLSQLSSASICVAAFAPFQLGRGASLFYDGAAASSSPVHRPSAKSHCSSCPLVSSEQRIVCT